MLTRVHHVGLVVRRLEDGLAFWRDALGLRISRQATVRDQGVRAALLPIGRSEIELLEPVDPGGGVAKFLERRGEGLHHVCFETPEVAAELAAVRAEVEAKGEGLAGLGLEVEDLEAAPAALARFAPVGEPRAVRLEPARCGGVPLTLRSSS